MCKIVSTYLGISELVTADACALEAAVKTVMEVWELKGENIVGLGTDGANVMTGEHHSLQSLMKESWPHLIHLKCICHTLDLIARGAVSKCIPSNVEFLIRESYNWFCHSSNRQAAYREILELVGFSKCPDLLEEIDTPDGPQQFLKLISPCTTRFFMFADKYLLFALLVKYHWKQ